MPSRPCRKAASCDSNRWCRTSRPRSASADTGPGIPPELREKIFRLYFTTKKEGSGIGLAMTFRVVQMHDGTIDFSSEPGQGTTFVLRLPLAG